MLPFLRIPSLFPAWIFLAVVLLSGLGRGQSMNTLCSFGTSGLRPIADTVPDVQMGLVAGTDGNFYGTTSNGTFYSVSPQNVLTVLHTFANSSTEGGVPQGGLILGADGNFYGTTSAGGAAGEGTFFRITPQGAVTTLHHFGNGQAAVAGQSQTVADGNTPLAGVIQGPDGSFYGTTSAGGANGTGTVFKMTAQGVYTILHSFGDGSVANDATAPAYGLVLDAQGNLYGTSSLGGSNGTGAVYEINATGQASVLLSFKAPSYTFTIGTQSTTSSMSGYTPNSALALGADGNLYGTAVGSAYGAGAVYQVTPSGVLTYLHYFGDGSVAGDGAESVLGNGRLALGLDNNFYGTTPAGGTAGEGTVFKITPAGAVTILHSFGNGSVSPDGNQPLNGVIVGPDGDLYGTTPGGGASGVGVVFAVRLLGPELLSPSSITVQPGQAISYQMNATGSGDIFSAGPLPAGFSFDGTHGTLTGTAPATGPVDITMGIVNNSGGTIFTFVINVATAPVISSLLNVVGSTSSLTYQIQATQNPTSFAATGLPPGVMLDSRSGFLLGTPTVAGTYPVTVTASNAVGTGTATVTMQILATPPTASQEYTLIHSFADGSVPGEGTFPGPMILGNDATLYGVTGEGGANGGGTVFNLSPAGHASVLANLGGNNGSQPQGLVQAKDGTIYGTAASGGSANVGTIFKIAPDGTFTLLHTFGVTAGDGATPQAGLVLASDGNFYGTTQFGGTAGNGTVYQMTPSGVVTVIHSFGDGTVAGDGAQPVAALILPRPAMGSFLTPDGVLTNGSVALVGTTLRGGTYDEGTAFAISSTGTVQILHNFGNVSATQQSGAQVIDTNPPGDGEFPRAALTATSLGVFGTTSCGGSNGTGTIFMLYGEGPGYFTIHNFGDGSVANDGENPNSPMVIQTPVSSSYLVANPSVTLYGTTQGGGAGQAGTVFSCTVASQNGATVSTTVTILHSFDDGTVANDGTIPLGGLCCGADENLYGTTIGGGAGSGTAFGLQINTDLGVPIYTSLPAPSGVWYVTGNLPPGLTLDSTTGLLSGTPLATDAGGNYTFTLTQYGNGVIQGTPETVTVRVKQTFAVWAGLHAVSSVVTSGSTGGTADGVPMALKYLFDVSNPGQTMSVADHAAMPTMCEDDTLVPGKPYVGLKFRKYAGMTGMSVTLETSTDMVNWSSAPPQTLVNEQVDTDQNTHDPIMEMATPLGNSPQQFLRLSVTPQ